MSKNHKIYFIDMSGNKHYIEKNFDSEKNKENWREVGLEVNEKKYIINLLNGKININGEWMDLGKDINGYYEKFTGRGLEYGKNLFYYCESVPVGIGSVGVSAKNIYLGYECDLEKLKINYGLYSIEKYIVYIVYNCKSESVGFSLSTDINFFINGKKIHVKI